MWNKVCTNTTTHFVTYFGCVGGDRIRTELKPFFLLFGYSFKYIH